MITTPEDADALFGAAAPSPPPTLSRPLEPEVDARRDQRVKVSWPARIQLPNGRVVDLRVRDVSENGVGLVGGIALPAGAVLQFAMGVPNAADPAALTPVTARIKTAYTLLQGRDLYCGGQWVSISDEALELVAQWVRRLRR